MSVENIPNSFHSEPVVFVPDNNLQSSDPEYTYYYDLIEFVDIVNTALASAYTLLVVDDPTLPSTPPFVNYNYITKLYELYVPKDAVDRVNHINITFNDALNPLFLLPSKFNKSGHELIIKNRIVNVDPTNTYLIMSADVEVKRNPNLQKIIFVANYGLPISSEFIQGPPLQVNQNNSHSAIITDFEPDIEQNNAAWLQFQSAGVGNIRLIDFKSDMPVQSFQIQVFWQDRNNVIRPVMIDRNTTGTLKLAFVPKAYFLQSTYYGN
jgi:hypothetical protein